MSRRRNDKIKQQNFPQHPPQRKRNTHADRPVLSIGINFLPDSKVEVDPKYNAALIEQLDVICQDSDEYDPRWEDEHKIAYYIWTLMDGFLSQWDMPISQEEVNAAIPGVPHIKEDPIVDRFDLKDTEIAKL